MTRDHFVYVPNQWESMLHCNDAIWWHRTGSTLAQVIMALPQKFLGWLHLKIFFPAGSQALFPITLACVFVVLCYVMTRDHFVYVPNQWESMLHCNDAIWWHRTGSTLAQVIMALPQKFLGWLHLKIFFPAGSQANVLYNSHENILKITTTSARDRSIKVFVWSCFNLPPQHWLQWLVLVAPFTNMV